MIDFQLQPDAYLKLMAGSSTEITCSSCRISAPFEFSLQVVDRERNLSIWLDPPNDPFAIKGFVQRDLIMEMSLRRVADMNTLREVAAVFRDGLQDGAMLLLKHMLAARILQDSGSSPILCSYEQRAGDSADARLEFVIFYSEEGDPETVTVPYEMYTNLVSETAPIISSVMPRGAWIGWDDDTVEKLWKALLRHK